MLVFLVVTGGNESARIGTVDRDAKAALSKKRLCDLEQWWRGVERI